MAGYDDFWGKVGTAAGQAAPGMLDLGLGIYSRNQGQSEAANRLRKAQGPLYQQSMTGAQTALSRAGSMDPRAAANERFNAAQGMLSGVDAKDLDALMAKMHVDGNSGVSTYNPGVAGITPNGTPMNPKLAAYYAGKGARDSKLAYDSLTEGEAQIDRMLGRSGKLQQQAANTQSTGIAAQRTQPSRAAANLELLKGFGGVMKDSGMLGIGTDWLRKKMGGFDFARDLDFSGLNFDGLGDIIFG